MLLSDYILSYTHVLWPLSAQGQFFFYPSLLPVYWRCHAAY